MLGHVFTFVDAVVFLVAPGNLRSQRAVEKIGAVPGRDGTGARGGRASSIGSRLATGRIPWHSRRLTGRVRLHREKLRPPALMGVDLLEGCAGLDKLGKIKRDVCPLGDPIRRG